MGKEKKGLRRMIGETEKRFEKAGIDTSDAEWIYCRVMGLKRSELKTDRAVSKEQEEAIEAFEEERLTGRPLWYVFGDADFCGCTLSVDERVLIPRPETELLVAAAVEAASDGDRILDLCTGSGCVAAAVYNGCEKRGIRVSVTASDISRDALDLARENALSNGAVVEFIESDLFSNISGRFDIIVCNPPYVPSGEMDSLQREVRSFEPRLALDGGEDGMDFFRRIARDAPSRMKDEGSLFLECGEGQAHEICDMFASTCEREISRDLAGCERFVKIVFKAK